MMPSPNPSLNPVAFDGPTGTQWGNMGAINDEESRKESRNRQYGYAIMACAVVALAVLMVILAHCVWKFWQKFLLLSLRADVDFETFADAFLLLENSYKFLPILFIM